MISYLKTWDRFLYESHFVDWDLNLYNFKVETNKDSQSIIFPGFPASHDSGFIMITCLGTRGFPKPGCHMARCQRGAKKAGWKGKIPCTTWKTSNGSDMFFFLLGGVQKLGRVWMSLVLLSFFFCHFIFVPWVLPVLNSFFFKVGTVLGSVRKSFGVQLNLNGSIWMEIEDEKMANISLATLGCRTPDWPCFSLSVDYEPWEPARSGDYEQELWQMPGAWNFLDFQDASSVEIFKILDLNKKGVINLLAHNHILTSMQCIHSLKLT